MTVSSTYWVLSKIFENIILKKVRYYQLVSRQRMPHWHVITFNRRRMTTTILAGLHKNWVHNQSKLLFADSFEQRYTLVLTRSQFMQIMIRMLS